MKPSIIAIDGPAASGKSTIGGLLAERLGYLFFDTGILYRAVTCIAQDQGLSVQDEGAVTRLAQVARIDVTPPSIPDGRQYSVWGNDQDITWQIRQPRVDRSVSVVSAYRGVRRAMLELQRQIGHRGQVVMVGRDIGSVVLPDADLKIYLDASLDERARRRYNERRQRGEEVDFETVRRDLARRDEIDSTREVAPLKRPEDAVYVDSTNLDIPEVLAQVLELAEVPVT